MSNIFHDFRHDLLAILRAMAAHGEIVFDESLADKITAEPPRQTEHGHIATNAAMVLAKANGCAPPLLAEKIATQLTTLKAVESTNATAGFVNCRLHDHVWHKLLETILAAEKSFGQGRPKSEKINVEYVSVNPTGPLHIGHARGAVVGDVLARLLRFCGYEVVREYYINDGGAQIEWLARSVYWRYLQASRKAQEKLAHYEAMEQLYPGDYLIAVGNALYEKHRDRLIDTPENQWMPIISEFAVAAMMAIIREDLEALRITHDVFVSEKELIARHLPEATVALLQEQGHLYEGIPDMPKGKRSEDWEPRSQLLFRSTDFGDDQDRALRKSDGSWTYFSTDIAYHLDKCERGFQRLINIFGADHGGYVARLKAAVEAMTEGRNSVEILTCQLVRFTDGGEPLKMSKRAGHFVTLRDLVDRVGADAVRIYMLMRKSDAQLDFDFAKVVEAHSDNPVFYIQYAHARSYSVERMFFDAFGADAHRHDGDVSLLKREQELRLLRKLAEWPRLLDLAAHHLEPHRISFYAYDVASLFHSLWNDGNKDESLRFIVNDNLALTAARMKLIMGVRYVLQSIADIIGFEALREL